MPLYEFRLEAQDGSGHFRRGTIASDTLEEAKATLTSRELEYEGYRLTTDEIADLEAAHGADVIQEALALPADAKMPSGLPPHVRAKLALHRQSQPYKLKSCKEKGEAS